ncbi:hypothetical protein [Winogradskyella sp.]|uniref:hypothetical protein n=1 Tax=Winogradskyella sp. TaxID=1883156 RepID=UPI003BAA9693
MQKSTILRLVLLILLYRFDASAQNSVIHEASGVARLNDTLYIVSDNTNGEYYKYSLRGLGSSIRLVLDDTTKLKKENLEFGKLELDLESIAILGNKVAVVSERNRSLLLKNSVLKTYPETFTEFANRGIEGLAIKTIDQSKGNYEIAAIWEGGYPNKEDISIGLGCYDFNKSMSPYIIIDVIKSNKMTKSTRIIELKMDEINKDIDEKSKDYIEPFANRLRAPDLVWYKDGFIVLLSSETGLPEKADKKFKYKFLQRFDIYGNPIGEPLDLKNELDKDINLNWEGLGWFVQDKSLILINDLKKKNDEKNIKTIVRIVKIP